MDARQSAMTVAFALQACMERNEYVDKHELRESSIAVSRNIVDMMDPFPVWYESLICGCGQLLRPRKAPKAETQRSKRWIWWGCNACGKGNRVAKKPGKSKEELKAVESVLKAKANAKEKGVKKEGQNETKRTDKKAELRALLGQKKKSALGLDRFLKLGCSNVSIDGRKLLSVVGILHYLGEREANKRDKDVCKLLGQGPEECAMVLQWLQFGQNYAKVQNAPFDMLKALEAHLGSRVFLVSNRMTIADLSVYSLVHECVASGVAGSRKRMLEYRSVVRWFDLIQHRIESIRFAKVSFDVDRCSSEGKKEEIEKKEEKPVAKEEREAKPQQPQPKQPKQPKKQEAVEEAVPPMARVDIRVGHVLKAEKHADADSLYVETVDMGEAQPRTVVSGLSGKIPLEAISGQLALFVCNLKPAAMRGVKSEAMILVASCEDRYELVKPPMGSVAGDRVFVEGLTMKPDEQLNPKKKIIETVKPEWRAVGGVAMFGSSKFMTSKGHCFTEQVTEGSIS